ncbi:MAG: amidotransferase 1, exosortase A system-associated, partial [Proteobacteria bacterium]|nr:amidotransferase 1, exosortase A system-associated [Pseudomonadota bacterium]
MCGISGIVDLKGRRPIDRSLVRAMNDTLVHRGPDGEGFHFEPGVGFGHRRLSIIDLEGGKQPLYNEDQSVVVTYNGEIYNFKALAVQLQAAGHTFRTHCDTEVIVHAWEEWGAGCLDRFNGMFAFALWDSRTNTLFLARDRLGIKPLYYSNTEAGYLVFGSELKAVVAHPDVQRKIDPQAVEEYFTFGYTADPRSIYRDVKKLEAGTMLQIRRGQALPAPRRYWDVPLDRPPAQQGLPEETYAEVREGLQASVNRRLVADVPLGAFLSGGVDSSAIVSMMRELGTNDILTCSIGFKESRYDESRYADIVARQKHTNHKKEMVEAADYGLLDKLIDIYDEPYADSSAIPTYRVCELARRHVTVALSGDGGDENFIGYRRYKLFSNEESIRASIPAPLRRIVFGALGRWYPKLDWMPRIFRGKTTFQALARDSMEAYLHGVSIFPEEGRTQLFSERFKHELQGYRSSEVFSRHIGDKNFSDPLRMIQYLDFKTYLPCDILTKVDRASMAHGLEVRVPFLDHEFVSSVAGIDTGAKLRGGEGKYVLKESLRPLLDEEILYRAK